MGNVIDLTLIPVHPVGWVSKSEKRLGQQEPRDYLETGGGSLVCVRQHSDVGNEQRLDVSLLLGEDVGKSKTMLI